MLENIPKWFWFAIGAIILITIIAVVACNSSSASKASAIASQFNDKAIKDAIQQEVKKDVFDVIVEMQNSLMAPAQ